LSNRFLKEDLDIISEFKNKRILVIGDVMLDHYIFGKVDRISPEAPVPIVNFKSNVYKLGGAANVALNCIKLGAKVSLASVIGTDKEGTQLKELLNHNGIACDLILESKYRPTTTKSRVIGNNAQLLRIDNEVTSSLENEFRDNLILRITTQLNQFDSVIFEDYDKGVLDELLIEQIVKAANKLGIPTSVDPKIRNFKSYKNVTLFKPNLKELKDGLNTPNVNGSDFETLKRLAFELLELSNNKMIMVTLSEHGAIIVQNGQYYHAPAHIRNITDVSGAGDTVISVASLILACKGTSRQIIELSNLAGGLVCEKLGVEAISASELSSEVERLLS